MACRGPALPTLLRPAFAAGYTHVTWPWSLSNHSFSPETPPVPNLMHGKCREDAVFPLPVFHWTLRRIRRLHCFPTSSLCVPFLLGPLEGGWEPWLRKEARGPLASSSGLGGAQWPVPGDRQGQLTAAVQPGWKSPLRHPGRGQCGEWPGSYVMPWCRGPVPTNSGSHCPADRGRESLPTWAPLWEQKAGSSPEVRRRGGPQRDVFACSFPGHA